jgi:hypothetical protein
MSGVTFVFLLSFPKGIAFAFVLLLPVLCCNSAAQRRNLLLPLSQQALAHAIKNNPKKCSFLGGENTPCSSPA